MLLEFYRDGLGLESCELVGTEYPGDDLTPAGAAAMFKLTGGLMLMLYPRSKLAKDANVAPGSAQSGEFSIGHAVPSRADVDALLARAGDAGATLTDRPHDRPWASTASPSRRLRAGSGPAFRHGVDCRLRSSSPCPPAIFAGWSMTAFRESRTPAWRAGPWGGFRFRPPRDRCAGFATRRVLSHARRTWRCYEPRIGSPSARSG